MSSRQESKEESEESENKAVVLKVAEAVFLILAMGKKEKKWR